MASEWCRLFVARGFFLGLPVQLRVEPILSEIKIFSEARLDGKYLGNYRLGSFRLNSNGIPNTPFCCAVCMHAAYVLCVGHVIFFCSAFCYVNSNAKLEINGIPLCRIVLSKKP